MTDTTDVEPLQPTKIKAVYRVWVARYQERHPSEKISNRALAEKVGINESSFSSIRNGTRRPLGDQCRKIAQFFQVSLEDVLRIEGYPDVRRLIRIVEKAPQPETEEERGTLKYALDILRMAVNFSEWLEIDQQSQYKQQADEILASDMPPVEKAIRYADVIWNWYPNRRNDVPRWQRKTDEFAALAGHAS